MPEGTSAREQHLYQDILSELLRNDLGYPSVKPCARRVQLWDLFGDFSLTVGHPNAARRLDCLRGAVDYLLRQTINEFDFQKHKDKAYRRRKDTPCIPAHSDWPF